MSRNGSVEIGATSRCMCWLNEQARYSTFYHRSCPFQMPSVAREKTSENDTDNSEHTPTSPTPAASTTMTSPVVTRLDTDVTKKSPSARSSEADELPCVVSPPADPKAAPPSFPDTANGEISPAKSVDADESKLAEPEPVHVSRMRSAAKELFVDLRPSSDVVIGQQQLCPNTRVKHLQTIAAWLADEAAANTGSGDDDGVPRSMVIVGRPGIGKTCLVAEVVRRYGSQVAGYHFFNYNSAHPDHNDPCAAILSLAHHLCDVFPNYVTLLPTEEKLEALIAQSNIGHMYDALIARPLMSPELERDAGRRMLIVIDALDECSAGEREALLDVINEFNDNSPDWLYLLVTTTTPSGQVDDELENIVVLEMKTSSENLVDIKRYLKEPLGLFMDRISLDGGLTTLAKKTHGNFLCARLYAARMRSLPRHRRVALREVDALLPTGFGDALREVFRNLRDLLSQDASTSEADAVYGDVIGVLALAREPLHRCFVAAVAGDEMDADALFAELSDVICSPVGPDHVCFIHRAIGDWLMNESKAGECAIKKAAAHARLADMCTDALSDIVGDNPAKPEALAGLRPYALKHAIEHLTDTPKRQTTIARLLCSLTYVADKIKVDDVSVRHVIADYAHEHFRLEEDAKLVTLAGYMKKQPKLADDIGNYAMFVQRKGPDIDACPASVNNVAANYPSCPAIAEAARSSLAGRPWLEELTAMPLTSCLSRPMRAHVCGFDVSPDCRTIAVLCKDDDYNLSLRLISTATLDDRVPPVDVKDLPDRVGLAVRFMPDNANVFVGSLTTYITTKGRAVPTGYETAAIDLAERYSVESCDVSARHFACALTTFPWGGRSLHLAVFDQRTKRCLRTLEVLRFRFGGSAQFGIRACALSDEHHLMCAAVKQTTKPELKVYVWDTTRWAIIGSVFVDGDSISKCAFVGASTVILGSGVRSTVADKYGESAVRVPAVTWKFRSESEEGDGGAAAESCVPLNAGELTSVFCSGQGATTAVSWSGVTGSAVVSVWHDASLPSAPSALYRVRGLEEMLDMTTCGKMMTFVSSDELRMYRFDDLEAANTTDDGADGVAALADMRVCSISFQPRTDIAFLVQTDADDTCSVCTLEVAAGRAVIGSTPFQKEPNPSGHCADRVGQFRCFRGPRTSLDVCCSTLDGNFVVFNSGRRVKVWNRAEDTVTELPEAPDEQCDEFAQCTRVSSLVAPKDATVAVVYGQLPFRVFFYDLKSGRMLRKLGLHGRSDRERVVSDFAYLPSTGYLATYHRDFGNTLAVWNPRNGQQINKQEAAVGYAKASPASDRIVVSLRETDDDADGGALLLRNADGRFRSNLQLPVEWPPEGELSDVDFSADGTTLVGVCVQAGVCRVWNAGNGEVLRDLSPGFVGGAEIVGMVTNTHVLFQDERLLAVDIASGDVVVALPVDQLERKLSARGVRIAPRGSFVIGADAAGQVALFLCHNFTAVQRSTTLQRMKSFTKNA